VTILFQNFVTLKLFREEKNMIKTLFAFNINKKNVLHHANVLSLSEEVYNFFSFYLAIKRYKKEEEEERNDFIYIYINY